MSLAAGSVTVDDEGERTGSGMALSIYDAQLVTMADFFADVDEDVQLDAKRGIADFSGALAAGIVDYILSNAVVSVTITTSDSGLQRTPNPNNPDTATQAPATNKVLSGTLT